MPGTERTAQNYPYHPPLEQVILKYFILRTIYRNISHRKGPLRYQGKKNPANIWRDLHALRA